MSSSAAANPLSMLDVAVAFGWVLAAGPVPVVTGALALARRLVPREIAVIAWPAAIATLALLFYPDGSFSPRYMLATVPIACFIPAALWLKGHRRLLVVSLAVPLAAALIATQGSESRGRVRRHARHARERAAGKRARRAGAFLSAGQACCHRSRPRGFDVCVPGMGLARGRGESPRKRRRQRIDRRHRRVCRGVARKTRAALAGPGARVAAAVIRSVRWPASLWPDADATPRVPGL